MKKYFMLLAAALLTVTTISLSSCSKKDSDKKDSDKTENTDGKAAANETIGTDVSSDQIDEALVLVFNAATDRINEAGTIEELDAIYAELDGVVDEIDSEYPDYEPSEEVMEAMQNCATAYGTRKAEL